MKKIAWKRKITEQCKKIGTYKDAFDPVIDALAATLEQRDKTHEEFINAGGLPVVEYTNKFGATNLAKNPYVVLWDDLNKSALAMWRDLGLTPAGYKKITDEMQTQKKSTALGEVLSRLENS